MEKYRHAIPFPSQKRKKKSSKCFVFVLAFLVLLSIGILGFSLIVLRINSPILKLETVEIKNLTTTNMSLVTGITIKNTNYGRFKFEDGKIRALFGNATIGSRKIGGGLVNGREKLGMNVTVHVSMMMMMMDGWDGRMMFVEITILARLRGEFLVLKKIRRYRTALMNCTMNFNFSNQQVQLLQCI